MEEACLPCIRTKQENLCCLMITGSNSALNLFHLLIMRITYRYCPRAVNTKFLKADFQTNGITSSGNNYDSYVDDATYYAVKSGGQPQKFTLKRKAIKT